ncbi:MAG: radical SAM family heme chaperone HemW [Firmicutes bacterium]|nr:radical SAM family heme chaperone HemW [Bacillota bacterium]
MTNNLESMGIYIHVPFCLHKCAYCDFYSVPMQDPEVLENYTRTVIKELELRQTEMDCPVTTIYLGGGTPSRLSPVQIARILNAVFTQYRTSGEPEISMEVNPATVNRQDLRDLLSAGVNRLSIGVQSFADAELQILGRMHSSAEAATILAEVREAGFDNFNIDLIYGVPGQTLAGWQENLKLALDFHPTHISAYLLQLDTNTPMARKIAAGSLTALAEDLEADMFYGARDYLQQQGYQHYEISNFARPGQECQHNLLYWRCRKYLGIGPGAVSFNGQRRILNPPRLEEYMAALLAGQAPAWEIIETMDARQQAVDAIIMGLRLTEGISLPDFLQRFDVELTTDYQHIIQLCQQRGLLQQDHDRLYLTPRGYFLSNQVLSLFVD